jgi:hypothetical protein
MLDLSIYLKSVSDDGIKKWEERFVDTKMKVEVHPEFSFFNYSGFLPFKVHFDEPSVSLLSNKDWLSGFEIYIGDYSFDDAKKEAQPKKSFIKSLFSSTKDDIVVCKEIDSILSKCKKEITLRWGTQDTLELRMAVLSSAILMEVFEGVCFDPQEGRWDISTGAFDKFLSEVNGFESTIKPSQWKLHEFEKWT